MMNQKLTGVSKSTTMKLFEGERVLVCIGLLGFVLAAACGIWVLVYGGATSPNGDVSRAISFDAALGIFLLSTAAISPLSGMSFKKRAFFRWAFVILALYSYGAETIQNFRGVNPRFVNAGSFFDHFVANGFGLVALLLVIAYISFSIPFFRKRASQTRPEIVLAIRYALLATMLSFAAGIWISMNQSRFTGLEGNIIWLHGLGFHGLQVLPLIAWLTEHSTITTAIRCRVIHLSGILYFLGVICIGWQTALGKSIWEWSWLPLLACGCFIITIVIGAIVLYQAKHILSPAYWQKAGNRDIAF